MTISSTTSRNDYTATAGQTIFPYTFKILATSELAVYLNGTLKTESSDYTVSGATNAGGGNVTFLAGTSASDTVAIVDVPALTQLTHYIQNDSFPAPTHENALDKLTRIALYLKQLLSKSVMLAISSTVSGLTIEEPIADSYVKWDSTGKILSNANAPTNVVTTTGIQTLTNKTLTLPKINENVQLAGTSTQIDSAISLKHTQNTDQYLDYGGVSESTAASVASAVSLKHTRQHSIISTTDHTSTATAGKMLKADANGLPVDANNTDTQVSATVAASHTQNTDTGTTSQTFQLQSGSIGVKLKNNGGVLEAVDATGTSYVKINALAPTDATNVATKKYVDDTISAGVAFATAVQIIAGTETTRAIAPDQLKVAGIIPQPNHNLIINGGFTINQRAYGSAGTLAAGVYGHDRWKAGSGGGNYSFTQLASPTTITVAANKTLIQVIEDVMVYGGTYILSWKGTCQARYAINSATPAGAYAASPITITGQTAGTTMSVEFGNGAASGTLGEVQLELSGVATPFDLRNYTVELALCQRYYWTSAVWVPSSTAFPTSICSPVNMRANPTIAGGGAGWNLNQAGTQYNVFYNTTGAVETLTFSAEL
jgi:hypothetical protein